jgi:hypothetical protein
MEVLGGTTKWQRRESLRTISRVRSIDSQVDLRTFEGMEVPQFLWRCGGGNHGGLEVWRCGFNPRANDVMYCNAARESIFEEYKGNR